MIFFNFFFNLIRFCLIISYLCVFDTTSFVPNVIEPKYLIPTQRSNKKNYALKLSMAWKIISLLIYHFKTSKQAKKQAT